MRRKEDRKWVPQFKRKHPSAVMEEGGGACGWRQVGDDCSVHKKPNKKQKAKSKQQAGEQGETSTGQTGSSQDRRGDRGARRWAQGYLHNRKKRTAYFGKSLVRLACNQEKNKETNQMKQRDGKRNRTKEKKTATARRNI